MNYASMFSSAGVGSTYLKLLDFNLIVASELIPIRAKLHKHFYPESEIIIGDITLKDNYMRFKEICLENEVDFILATPPCQGFSLAGKNKNISQMLKDERNYLIFSVIKAILDIKPTYSLIENVPRFINMGFPYNDELTNVVSIISDMLKDEYVVESIILNSKNFDIPQNRERSFIKIHKKNVNWNWPKKSSKIISVRDAIGHLPSIESGQISDYKWHYGRKHIKKHIIWMKHTPTGKSAFQNKEFFPSKENGKKLRGFSATYMRMEWDKPAPTITIRNDAISSQSNVHPGRLKNDGTYSDARVLSILELIILSSLPENWDIPEWASEILIRQVIGESVPPKLIYKIMEMITK